MSIVPEDARGRLRTMHHEANKPDARRTRVSEDEQANQNIRRDRAAQASSAICSLACSARRSPG
jgi:hypothetical protein